EAGDRVVAGVHDIGREARQHLGQRVLLAGEDGEVGLSAVLRHIGLEIVRRIIAAPLQAGEHFGRDGPSRQHERADSEGTRRLHHLPPRDPARRHSVNEFNALHSLFSPRWPLGLKNLNTVLRSAKEIIRSGNKGRPGPVTRTGAAMTPPELVLINADIRTMDPHFPRVSALAVRRGRVAALGSDGDIRALAATGTKVIDAGGRLVLPGFHDTHLHVQDGGQHYAESADLSEARIVAELQATLRAFAASHDREWVYGGFYYSGVFGEHNLNRQVLDAAVPDRPCMIMASDGHNGC